MHRLVGRDLGVGIRFTNDVDADWCDARYDSTPNATTGQRIKQDGESLALGRIDCHDAIEADSVLELLQVIGRVNDWIAQGQDVVAILVGPGLVANLDDAGLPNLKSRFLFDAVPARTLFPHGVNERVVGLGRNFHPLARLHFFQSVAHRLGSYSKSRKVSLVVNLLHVGGDRLFDQHMLVFRIGIADPQIFPAPFGNAGDRPHREPCDVGARGKSKRDLPVLFTPLRTRCTEEQHLTRRKALEPAGVDFAGEQE